MKEQKENTVSSTITLEKKVVAHHLSDGGEVIPTEVQVNIRHHSSQVQDLSLATGYTIDDEVIINNYAILPDPWHSIPQQNSSNVIYY